MKNMYYKGYLPHTRCSIQQQGRTVKCAEIEGIKVAEYIRRAVAYYNERVLEKIEKREVR